MTKLKLWISNGACSLAPHIVLHETGLDFETVVISVMGGFPKEYLHINPKGKVPILELDGNIITEIPAIMTAISQLCPEKNLLGTTPLEIVRTYEWFNWISGVLHGQGYGKVFRPARFTDDEQQFDAVRADGKKTVQECYSDIDKKLTGLYAVGENFTAVDAYLLVFYLWGGRTGFDMKAEYPNYTRLVHKLRERESIRKAVDAEGLDLSRL
ncbi:hypothetical protein AJ80_05594 [Polytolypa hystricis UAMH7299]|uniref:Glutathione S-transferase n=1 Tax=Polytolypa hystricis (strain UAMH7299) TaxID=1447883 RepID=A0A2B7Y2G3_POLH7|nr:hypothetical protein AJ80_05594 [Polytolypa hystricis UAMH7299]